MTNRTSAEMLVERKRSKGAKTAILFWPLLFYGLIRLAADLVPSLTQNSSCLHYHNQHHQDDISHHISSLSKSQVSVIQQQQQEQQNAQSKPFCSSASRKISTEPTLLSPATYLTSLLQFFEQHRGPSLLLAEASSLYNPNQDKEIIILNSTNFNTELIQNHSPLPHIKLIEYYVSFCGFCAKFKATYTKLARDIHSWRNVIRPSAIDLGVSSNSPIAHSWLVDVVPTLRVHPPPSKTLASALDEQLTDYVKSAQTSSELHKKMFGQFRSSNLTTQSLEVSRYMDKVSLLKSDLLNFIERYVRETSPSELPDSWPNLMPVVEDDLISLRLNHPRKELFLIIEGPSASATSDSDQSYGNASLGLNVMMELSSASPWRAVRYVRAGENKALIEDVIRELKKFSERQSLQQKEHAASITSDQIEMLSNILIDKQLTSGNNQVVLVHIDDSHTPTRRVGKSENLTAIPSMTVVSGSDLITVEQAASVNDLDSRRKRAKRSLFGSSEILKFEELDVRRKIELIALYIKQTYTEVAEDRFFLETLNYFDDNVWMRDVDHKLVSRLSSDRIRKIEKMSDNEPATESSGGVFGDFMNLIRGNCYDDIVGTRELLSESDRSEYHDKLKAIRYMLFQEVPRKQLSDKTILEKQDYLNTLMNLITVIKAYFPLPDSSSIQFIDGVYSYLAKQQSRFSSINTQERNSDGPNFDTRAFKLELKRLESDGKRLPETEEWKYCRESGYPCALWRLFHTLTAFEYKKLSQIHHKPLRELSEGSFVGLERSGSRLAPTMEAITAKQNGSSSNDSLVVASPVERLVSPPSTTTSLSLTIATSTSSSGSNGTEVAANNNNTPASEADLPMPVLLVMKDYIINYYSCEECVRNFRVESSELSLKRIRQQEPAEFSILWLWETHNRVNKRLSVDTETNPRDHPKLWFPTYDQCQKCYIKPPSFLKDDTTNDPASIFHEPIEWNKQEILHFLVSEYTKQPMDGNGTSIFGYQIPYGFGYLFVTCLCFLILIMLLRCASCYVERQRRHKATLLNGNGAHYATELQ